MACRSIGVGVLTVWLLASPGMLAARTAVSSHHRPHRAHHLAHTAILTRGSQGAVSRPYIPGLALSGERRSLATVDYPLNGRALTGSLGLHRSTEAIDPHEINNAAATRLNAADSTVGAGLSLKW